jgi:hypothetical protein
MEKAKILSKRPYRVVEILPRVRNGAGAIVRMQS